MQKSRQDALRERFVFLIDRAAPTYRLLESTTGIKARNWSNVVTKRQFPTDVMFAAIAELLPEYSQWLLTGCNLKLNQAPAPEEWQLFTNHREYLNKLPHRTRDDNFVFAGRT